MSFCIKDKDTMWIILSGYTNHGILSIFYNNIGCVIGYVTWSRKEIASIWTSGGYLEFRLYCAWNGNRKTSMEWVARGELSIQYLHHTSTFHTLDPLTLSCSNTQNFIKIFCLLILPRSFNHHLSWKSQLIKFGLPLTKWDSIEPFSLKMVVTFSGLNIIEVDCEYKRPIKYFLFIYCFVCVRSLHFFSRSWKGSYHQFLSIWAKTHKTSFFNV